MPVFILGALRFGKLVIGSKTGRIALLVIAGVIALGIAVWRIEAHGYNRAMAEVEAETAAEHQRRETVLQWAQDWARGSVARVDELKAMNDDLMVEINTKSADNNSKPALDSAAVRRLSLVGRKSGNGAGGAASATPGPPRR